MTPIRATTRCPRPTRPLAVVAVGIAALAMVAGCNKDEEGIAGGEDLESGRATSGGEMQEREPCRGSATETAALDVDGDGSPDIYHVTKDGRRHCSQYDMNFDGNVDVVRFYEDDGETTRREEHDFDFDGRLDQISFYEGGVLARKELDTNFDRRVDTWMWCEGGLVARAERDRHNTGAPDTWEVYEGGRLAQARYDDNNDGRPEKIEVFEDGRLAYIVYDSDQDGEEDEREEIRRADAGQPDPPISCDGRPVQEALDAAGAGSDFDDVETTPTPEAAEGEGSEGDAPAADGDGAEEGGSTWDALDGDDGDGGGDDTEGAQ